MLTIKQTLELHNASLTNPVLLHVFCCSCITCFGLLLSSDSLSLFHSPSQAPSVCHPVAMAQDEPALNDTNTEVKLIDRWNRSPLTDQSRDFHETNPLLTPYGRLEEGDLLRSPKEDRSAVTSDLLWENRHFFYEVADDVDRDAIEAGIDFWRDNTCIQFEDVPEGIDQPRVRFVAEQGCWSNVGYVAKYLSPPVQITSIGSGCTGLGTVTHEIAHSLGLYHEQSRVDRDDYVTILWRNINDQTRSNFVKMYQTEDHGVPYDLSSVMHYGTFSFSTNGKPTILTRDPTLQGLIGQRQQPSFRDVALMNLLYQCEELCSSRPACHNGGYVTADCVCHCPPGTSGPSCQTVTSQYYEHQVCVYEALGCPQHD